ncbi:MAG: CpsD/CapB family tyrosine-protein kinase [Pseudomonadota bacterium]
MEKLQQALEKARADRDRGGLRPPSASTPKSGAKPAAPGRAAKAAPVPADVTEDVWSELTTTEPDPARLTRNRVVTHSNSREATPFDILRTKIVLQMRKHGWRRLAITSATPTCGKSTIAANLVFGLARQSDTRAVLLEVDLHNPGLRKILGVEPARDVSRVLTGEVPFAEQALRLGDNVALSLAKGRTTDPTRVLFSQQAEAVIEGIEADYAPDLTIFDTAPILVSDDTRAFLGQVDCALIIACAEKTTIPQIDTCEREIAEHTNVLGVVLNQARFTASEDGYDYGYGYGY